MLLASLLALLLAAPAHAQGLESALSPGPLVRSHAKIEGTCSDCHVRFDRAGQDGRCTACHKDVGKDLQRKTGLHGKQPAQACRSCHTDHRGRDMNIAPLDTKQFDHKLTNYLLKGKHAGVDCKSCHVPGKNSAHTAYRQAPGDCLSCHRKDDKHKNSLGGACADCHTEQSWKEVRLDHDKTQFPLTGKHIDTRCDSCHKSKVYNEAPTTCVGCHRKEDKHKARYGEKCESCHTTRNWTGITFKHDTDTHFVLRDKHREARCDSCHTGTSSNSLYRDKLGSTCVDCHRKDDKHKARYGDKCESCHTARGWGGGGSGSHITFKHDTDTRYALRGKHRTATCDSCHTGTGSNSLYRDKLGSACADCHRKDDKHEGKLGTACVACHDERGWKETTRFDHNQSRFVLRGAHVRAECKSCHVAAKGQSAPDYRSAPSDCVACHRKDDKHEGTVGTACADCHTEANWKASLFKHEKTRFVLREGHAVPPLKCSDCHRDLRSYKPTALECVACHRKDDKHEAQLGTDCKTCHTERNWRHTPRFDHAKARMPLVGAHVPLACKSCHQSARYRDAPRTCVGCHQKDDKHKATLGAACESCHNVRDWRLWSYDHARQATYPLEQAHAPLACTACHNKPAPAGKHIAPVGRNCVACHQRDDVHDGAFGARCEQCHSVTRWKEVSNRARSAVPPPSGPVKAAQTGTQR